MNYSLEYFQRKLYKSLDFQNKRELKAFGVYSDSYTEYLALLCSNSSKYLNHFVFCDCCSFVKVYNRNDSLLRILEITNIEMDIENIKEEYKLTEIGGAYLIKNRENDNFLDFLESKLTKDLSLLRKSIDNLDKFWDGYLEALKYIRNLEDYTNFMHEKDQLKNEFGMLCKIENDIDTTVGFDFIEVPCIANIKAAYLYAIEDYEGSKELFKQSNSKNWAEIYALILSRENSNELLKYSNFISRFSNTYESYMVKAISCTAQLQYNKAHTFFTKALNIQNNDFAELMDIHVLILKKNHELALNKLQNFKPPVNYKIYYSLSMAYLLMKKHELALNYANMALDLKKCYSILKLIGKIYMKKEKFEKALHYFSNSLDFKTTDNESLLHLGEIHVRLGKPDIAVTYYEKYLKVGTKNIDTVKDWLKHYYDSQDQFDKCL